MAYEPVAVTQFRAKDGSLHSSRATAEAHDRYRAKRALVEAIADIVSQETWLGQLSDFCGYHQPDEWQRETRNEAIAEIIIGKWAELSAAIAKAEGRS